MFQFSQPSGQVLKMVDSHGKIFERFRLCLHAKNQANLINWRCFCLDCMNRTSKLKERRKRFWKGSKILPCTCSRSFTWITSVLRNDYLDVFCSSIVGEESSFIFAIEELHTLAMKMFFNSLSLHASKVLDKVSFFMIAICLPSRNW